MVLLTHRTEGGNNMKKYVLDEIIVGVIGVKKLTQYAIGYDFYNDGSVRMGRFSKGRYNSSRIQKENHRNKKSRKWMTFGIVA